VSTSGEDSTHQDPLEPVLREVEDELHRRLREACEAEAQGVSTESSAEIRRLEDALLKAAAVAEETLTLRRHIERRSAAPEPSSRRAAESRVEDESASNPVERERVQGVREFRDATGTLWRAWPVTPGQARKGEGRTAERYLGEYCNGWICFEELEGTARRRLPQQPSRWRELEDSDLQALLDRAISAPKRSPRSWNRNS
jgi:hypothetical protein